LAGLEILNSSNSIIAKFYNENYRVDLNGPTNILGDLYSSGKIDGYLFTPTEIKQRDTNALLIKNKDNVTAIKIDEVAVEIQQPLKVISSTNSSFAYGLSAGILQPSTTLGINCYSSGSFGGNLAVYGTSNFSGNLTVSRSAPTGNGNVAMSLVNTSTDGEGFASLYIHKQKMN
jgi:hypothetical protein